MTSAFEEASIDMMMVALLLLASTGQQSVDCHYFVKRQVDVLVGTSSVARIGQHFAAYTHGIESSYFTVYKEVNGELTTEEIRLQYFQFPNGWNEFGEVVFTRPERETDRGEFRKGELSYFPYDPTDWGQYRYGVHDVYVEGRYTLVVSEDRVVIVYGLIGGDDVYVSQGGTLVAMKWDQVFQSSLSDSVVKIGNDDTSKGVRLHIPGSSEPVVQCRHYRSFVEIDRDLFFTFVDVDYIDEQAVVLSDVLSESGRQHYLAIVKVKTGAVSLIARFGPLLFPEEPPGSPYHPKVARLQGGDIAVLVGQTIFWLAESNK